jgi:phosphoglucosamine mutase
MGVFFGTDGVRGLANAELTPELAYRLGKATAYSMMKGNKKPVFLIGKDTRLSGDMLESAIIAGILSVGADCVKVGVMPTPAIAYLTRVIAADAGVVISASHNPFGDNGIKFFNEKGFKFPDTVEDDIEKLVQNSEFVFPAPTGKDVGRLTELEDAPDRYVRYLLSIVHVDFKGLKIVIDCANGAGFEVAPRIFRALGAEVVVINDRPDGMNINFNCGSTHLEQLMDAVKQNKADVGLALDGDADRMLAVDENGQVIDGDQIMVILAKHAKKEENLEQNTLVATVMSNIGLYKALKNEDIIVKETKVGDRYVLEEMLASGADLGGEQSGHIIMLKYNTTGDGILTSLQLLSIMQETGLTASALGKWMDKYPQLLVNIRVKDKTGWDEDTDICKAISIAQEKLGEEGRILVRPSGTEPLIRVMAEGKDKEEITVLVNAIAEVIKTKLA